MRFFLVDRVDELVPAQLARGVKAITLSEGFLHDHFPEHPLMPGTLMIEALAQLGGLLVEVSHPQEVGRRAVLAQVDRAKFHHPARPGEVVQLECRYSSQVGPAVQVEGLAWVAGQKAVRADLTFVLKEVESSRVHQQRRELYALWTRHLQLDFPLP